MSAAYDFAAIEAKWQAIWEQAQTFRTPDPGQRGSEKPPYYVLDMFPYPSGAGLHIGHPEGYTATDILARYRRMRGFNVLHPMGWDAFGLPAEQYAIETGVHPRDTTRKNIETFRRQLKALGFSYDWTRELATTDPKYYRWTQWIFLKIYNSWYDPEHRWTDAAGRAIVGAARPIETLPIPAEIRADGDGAIEDFRAQHRLAYLAEVPVNWCPALGTVLANEEVTSDGRSERGNHPVIRRPLRQWMLRITEYADRLLADLDLVDWPDSTKLEQRAWIGRSEGAYIDFRLAENGGASENVIRVFTTRPDTAYGATYLVLAPEHPLVALLTINERRKAVELYVVQSRARSEFDRTADSKTKTGVFTGAWAINPVSGERVPIWVADYVLAGYGTGSIMAVPGSDQRDLAFAETFGLPVVQVVRPPGGEPWRGFAQPGIAVNSPPDEAATDGRCVLNGLATPDAKRRMIDWLEAHGCGEGTIQYKLHDWLFSRQRYWGEPFPILHGPDGRVVCERETDLPLRLPEIDDFRPEAGGDPNSEPRTPLTRAGDWLTVTRDGVALRREANTMPNWAGSCWYYLRFIDPNNEAAPVGAAAERYWSGAREAGQPPAGLVDLYMGGKEHAVLHLLYARFWHKVLYDLGCVSTPEPFKRLFHQGMILSFAYRDSRDVPIAYDEIEFRDDGAFHRHTGEKLSERIEKMSKTLKNVVNPDTVIAAYGADTLRLYEMYMGPLEATKPWSSRDIIGVHRFLQRVWRLVVGEGGTLSDKIAPGNEPQLERLLHRTIQKVTGDFESFGFNTAIAQLIVFVNEATKSAQVGRDQIERFLLLLAPLAPHVAEELWQRLGHSESLAYAAWPTFDPALVRDESVEIAVQIRGKLRGRITIAADATDEQVVAAAKALEPVASELAGKTIARTIVVKSRLVNLIPA